MESCLCSTRCILFTLLAPCLVLSTGCQGELSGGAAPSDVGPDDQRWFVGGGDVLTTSAGDAAQLVDAERMDDAEGVDNGDGSPLQPGGLLGEYYRKHHDLALTRVDPTVQFEWAKGEPAKGVGQDYFSVRWTGKLKVPAAGSYELTVERDDGVRLWVDGKMVLDQWTLGSSKVDSATVSLAKGEVPLRLEAFEWTGAATVSLRWSGPGIAEQVVPQASLVPADAPSGLGAPRPEGLRGEYFLEFDELRRTQLDAEVDFNWGAGGPHSSVGQDHFSVRWTGTLKVLQAGSYTFKVGKDDGARLWVHGKQVINKWDPGSSWVSATVDLPQGEVGLRLETYEWGGDARAILRWSGPGISEQVVPKDRLVPAVAPSGKPGPKPRCRNPITSYDCPDPGVLKVSQPAQRFYVACTGGKMGIRRSRDLVLWHSTNSYILPTGKAPWSANGARNWAPELHRVGSKTIAYFTAVNSANVLSIGAAYATDPLGPYTVTGGPLHQFWMGVIDANFFEDTDGRRYLFYKIDGNAHGKPTQIWGRELEASGLGFKPASSVLLLQNSLSWEGGIVEAPWVVKRNGTYYMFYSGNGYDARYRTGVARSTKVLAPYVKRGGYILGNNSTFVGPGHGSVVRVGSQDFFLYHAWGKAMNTGRRLMLDRITWANGWPTIGSGTPSTGYRDWPIP